MANVDDAYRRENALAGPLVRTDRGAAEQRTWLGRAAPAGYLTMIDEARTFLDLVVAASPSAEDVAEVTEGLVTLNRRLSARQVDEPDQLSGRLLAAPSRGQLSVPPVDVDELDDRHVSGRVRFGRHFLGSNGVVHGGAIPMLFDDLLGRLSIVGGRSRSRTAFLHIDYRSVAPVETELRVEASFDREVGRKRYIRGALYDGGRLCAEASALFLALKPEQP